MPAIGLSGISFRSYQAPLTTGTVWVGNNVDGVVAEATAVAPNPAIATSTVDIFAPPANATATIVSGIPTVKVTTPLAIATAVETPYGLNQKTIFVPPFTYVNQLLMGRGSTLTDTYLYSVDPLTGSPTPIGLVGNSLTGLARDPTTGIVYGISARNGTNPRSLLTINTVTGAGTVIAAMTPGGTNTPRIADIAFDNTGQLYGWAEVITGGGDDLVRIDKATGACTIVANSGINTYGSAIDFNGSQELWAALDGTGDDLPSGYPYIYKMNKTTGTSISSVPLYGPINPNYQGSSIAAGSFDQDNIFWALVNRGTSDPALLVKIDTTTGYTTEVGPTVSYGDALLWTTYGVPGTAHSSASARSPVIKVSIFSPSIEAIASTMNPTNFVINVYTYSSAIAESTSPLVTRGQPKPLAASATASVPTVMRLKNTTVTSVPAASTASCSPPTPTITPLYDMFNSPMILNPLGGDSVTGLDTYNCTSETGEKIYWDYGYPPGGDQSLWFELTTTQTGMFTINFTNLLQSGTVANNLYFTVYAAPNCSTVVDFNYPNITFSGSAWYGTPGPFVYTENIPVQGGVTYKIRVSTITGNNAQFAKNCHTASFDFTTTFTPTSFSPESALPEAGKLYAAKSHFAGNGLGVTDLYEIDVATGNGTSLGTLPFDLEGLVADESTIHTKKRLWGITSSDSLNNFNSLVRIDLETGTPVLTVIGSLGGYFYIGDLAMKNGNLYGWGENYNKLYSINKTTGAATPLGIDDNATWGNGIDFDRNSGVLYGLLDGDSYTVWGDGHLWTIDPITGTETMGIQLQGSFYTNLGGEFSAMTFSPTNNIMYAIDSYYGDAPAFLTIIDKITGDIINISELDDNLMSALAWFPTDPPAIATASVVAPLLSFSTVTIDSLPANSVASSIAVPTILMDSTQTISTAINIEPALAITVNPDAAAALATTDPVVLADVFISSISIAIASSQEPVALTAIQEPGTVIATADSGSPSIEINIVPNSFYAFGTATGIPTFPVSVTLPNAIASINNVLIIVDDSDSAPAAIADATVSNVVPIITVTSIASSTTSISAPTILISPETNVSSVPATANAEGIIVSGIRIEIGPVIANSTASIGTISIVTGGDNVIGEGAMGE